MSWSPPSLRPTQRIGKKIDYVTRRIEGALKPIGFVRHSRRLARTVGEGAARRVEIVDLQGDKWNSGSRGRFTVNLGVKFPALIGLQAQMPGLEWLAQHADSADLGGMAGTFQTRLGFVLPAARESWWLPDFPDTPRDLWIAIEDASDLGAIGEAVGRAVREYGLPWIEQHAVLSAFDRSDPDATGWIDRDAMCAALLKGDVPRAALRLREAPPWKMALGDAQYDGLLALARRHGVATEGLAWADRPPDPTRVGRQREVEALKTAHRGRVDQFLDGGQALAGRHAAFLEAWIDECAEKQQSDSVARLRLWPVAEAAPVEDRRALLVDALARILEPHAPVRSTVSNVWATFEQFHEHALGALTVGLLGLDADCGLEYGPPPAARAPAARREGHRRDHRRSLERPRRGDRALAAPAPVPDRSHHAPARSRRAARRDPRARGRAQPPTRHRAAGPRIPQRGAPRRARSRVLTQGRGPDGGAAAAMPGARVRRRRSRCRAAARALGPHRARRPRAPARSTNRRLGPASGGRARGAARRAPGGDDRLFEWFDEGVEARPSKRWLSELRSSASPRWNPSWLVPWVAATLSRFPDTRLTHIAAAPGFGAFPGATSGAALLGLVHATGTERCREARAALPAVVRGAFTVVPGQRTRAQSAGMAALPLLALDETGRASLRELAGSTRHKSIKSAIEKVLAG